MEQISRKLAIARGLRTYYTGVPCKHGHDAPRRVANCACTLCDQAHAKAFRNRQPEYYREYRLHHQEALREYDRDYYRKRKERPDA